jgi:hypothetical protein
MMFKNNFAAAILVGNKVLREFDDIVYLPFGSEYSIRLKNLSNSRCKVNVEIDGDIATGSGIVIDGFSHIDLERFVRSDLDKGNRFKFIERTSKIEEHRGVKVEDGIVSVRYEFEVPTPIAQINTFQTSNLNYPPGVRGYKDYSKLSLTSSTMDVGPTVMAHYNCANPGITVEGSQSNQKFTTTCWKGSIGGTHVLNFRLMGFSGDLPIKETITVKTKAKCKTCGKVNRATSKFCSECGTSLTIFD